MKATKVIPESYDVEVIMSYEEARVIEFFLNYASSKPSFDFASSNHGVNLDYFKYDEAVNALWKELNHAIGEDSTLREYE